MRHHPPRLYREKKMCGASGDKRADGGEGRKSPKVYPLRRRHLASTWLTLHERPMKLLFGFGDISMTAIAGLVLLHA